MTMSRTTATFSVSVPPEMAVELERVRKVEHRTRSELVREALRHYIRAASLRRVKDQAAALPEAEPEADEIEAVTEGRRAFAAGRSAPLRHALDRRPKRSRSKKP
jgi:CopG family transcriptional regulator/antitoxin EndoAI